MNYLCMQEFPDLCSVSFDILQFVECSLGEPPRLATVSMTSKGTTDLIFDSRLSEVERATTEGTTKERRLRCEGATSPGDIVRGLRLRDRTVDGYGDFEFQKQEVDC